MKRKTGMECKNESINNKVFDFIYTLEIGDLLKINGIPVEYIGNEKIGTNTNIDEYIEEKSMYDLDTVKNLKDVNKDLQVKLSKILQYLCDVIPFVNVVDVRKAKDISNFIVKTKNEIKLIDFEYDCIIAIPHILKLLGYEYNISRKSWQCNEDYIPVLEMFSDMTILKLQNLMYEKIRENWKDNDDKFRMISINDRLADQKFYSISLEEKHRNFGEYKPNMTFAAYAEDHSDPQFKVIVDTFLYVMRINRE